MARKANGTDFGNMEWKARDWGYNVASSRPTMPDIDALIASAFPNIKFTVAQHSELLLSADYAYMMRLKHRASTVHSATVAQ
jgi:hypothetical protein